MTDKIDEARAALEAALASTSSGGPAWFAQAEPGPQSTPATPAAQGEPDVQAEPGAGRRRRPKAWQPIPGDPESDPRTRDGEPDAEDVARSIVLRQLAMAPRSRKQLHDKLRQRNCPDEVAERVLDRMTDVGLVDDEAYAGMLVRSQQASRGLAKRALARELRTKGVDDETAKAALDEVSPEHERAQAERLVAKKLRTMHGLDATVQTRRLAGMLARKGYPADLSMQVIREAVRQAPEHQRD
ncbi:regulatory protein RecX [Knoellia koreensis]|jgi:regulatory protein